MQAKQQMARETSVLRETEDSVTGVWVMVVMPT